MKSLFKFLLIMSWMIVINQFSSQVGADSSKTSGFVLTLLTKIGIDLNSMFGQIAHLLLRKAAHMFIYFVLFLLSYQFMKDFLKFKSSIISSLILSFVFSTLDEYHQTFVPNRAGSFTDVLIDMCGVLIGIVLLIIIRFLIHKPFPTKPLKTIKNR